MWSVFLPAIFRLSVSLSGGRAHDAQYVVLLIRNNGNKVLGLLCNWDNFSGGIARKISIIFLCGALTVIGILLEILYILSSQPLDASTCYIFWWRKKVFHFHISVTCEYFISICQLLCIINSTSHCHTIHGSNNKVCYPNLKRAYLNAKPPMCVSYRND